MARSRIMLPKMDTGQMIALGATGLALTAGAIAAGVAFSNRGVRTRLTREARRGIKSLKQGMKSMQEEYQRYQPIALRVSRTKKRKGLLKKTRK